MIEPAARDANNTETRQRILDAAAQVFADKGFRNATVREIVERANANLNAVNYYFRDKRSLYCAVFDHAQHTASARDAEEFAEMRSLPADQRLKAFVVHFFRGFDLEENAPWQVRLMLRETVDPTGAFDVVIERLIRPRFNELVAIVREIVPADLPEWRIRLCAEHIVAQCVHLIQARPIVIQLIPELDYSPPCIEKTAEHIAAFSIAALRNLSDEESVE